MSEISVPSRHGAPASQGTQIEQSRAIAEVQAMVVIAQNSPRDLQRALDGMRQSCTQKSLADRAFFAFPRGGQQITGPSVQLARELARVWGNVTYGVTELSRDDVKGESEMLAFAWDVETNTRAAQIFINPHARDTKGGRRKLNDLRDIYESNANVGARRVREMIFAVLPGWFTDEAVDLCQRTMRDGGGQSLRSRVDSALSKYAAIGVGTALLEEKVGRKTDDWTADDVARLGVVWTSIDRGETTIAESFPSSVQAQTTRVTADQIGGGE